MDRGLSIAIVPGPGAVAVLEGEQCSGDCALLRYQRLHACRLDQALPVDHGLDKEARYHDDEERVQQCQPGLGSGPGRTRSQVWPRMCASESMTCIHCTWGAAG